MTQIDKNIPPPPPRRSRIPWKDMEVGDSVLTNTNDRAYQYWTKNNGKKFTCRAVTENGVRGYRVWRIK